MVVASEAIVDGVKELLVPTKRARKLRHKFIFCFNIIRPSVRVSDIRNFEASLINFSPQLQMMQCKTDVLSKDEFPVIIEITSGRQRCFGFTSKIWTFASGETKVPCFA